MFIEKLNYFLLTPPFNWKIVRHDTAPSLTNTLFQNSIMRNIYEKLRTTILLFK